MSPAALLLLAANVVYATSPAATRIALDAFPPATLALVRLVVAAAVLAPVVRATTVPRGRRARIVAMGVVGFAVAFALMNWGIEHSSATNAALLIIVEPLTLLLLGPALLGERPSRREVSAALAALLGAVVVIADGVPGMALNVLPRWRGDSLLVLSGVAYAAYSLLGRPVLTAVNATAVTARSIVWGAVAMAPLAALEWLDGRRPTADPAGVAAALYLAVVITAGGYVVWNRALARLEASRTAPFLAVQPIVGALLGAALLGDPVSVYTGIGGALIVGGLWMSATARP